MEKGRLIRTMIDSGALKTREIIDAFKKVPREEFCLPEYRKSAYDDVPLPIIAEQTISQPSTIAMMTEALEPKKGQKILEIGTGSGYQAAILAEIVKPATVYSVEIIPELVDFAKENLQRAGIKNVKVILGDGSMGLQEEAPYDRIIVTAGAPEVPAPLKDQLKVGGVLVIPVGHTRYGLEMLVVKKIDENTFETSNLGAFAFVPLTGKYGQKS